MNDKKHENNSKITYPAALPAILALLFAGLFLGLFLWRTATLQHREYQVVILGDSIMGRERYWRRCDEMIADASGMTVFNGAFGGTTASTNDTANRYDYHEDSLNLCRLVDAICARDFGEQLADLPNNQYQSFYFEDALRDLSKVNFAKARVVLLEHGLNDYLGARAQDDPEDPYNLTTYAGGLRYSIEKLSSTYPNLRIILVSPSFCWVDESEPCDKEDFGNGILEVYAATQKRVAAEYGLSVIDPLHELGMDAENVLSLTEDGIHLNDDGRLLYGTFVGKELKKLMKTDENRK